MNYLWVFIARMEKVHIQSRFGALELSTLVQIVLILDRSWELKQKYIQIVQKCDESTMICLSSSYSVYIRLMSLLQVTYFSTNGFS